MNIFVGGVNGAGKTTILEVVKRLRPDWKCVKGSRAFMEWLGFPGDYKKLRALEPDILQEKLTQFMLQIIEEGQRVPFQILDSHYLNLTYGKIEKRTGLWLKDFDGLVLISAPVDIVIPRIQSEGHIRDRALFARSTPPSEEHGILESYINETEKEFLRLAEYFHLPFLKIENEDREDSGRKLVAFAESLS